MKLFVIGENGRASVLNGAKMKTAPMFEKGNKRKKVPSSAVREEIQLMLLKIGSGLPKLESAESDDILSERCA